MGRVKLRLPWSAPAAGQAAPPSPRTRAFAVAGGVLVALAGVAGTLYLSRNGPAVGTTDQSGPTTTVVIARLPINGATKIVLGELTTASLPSTSIPADALRDPTGAVGLYAAVTISANQIIVPAMLTQAVTSDAHPINPIHLSDGDVAMAIPDDPLRGAGDYILAGDHIDIIVDINGLGSMKYVFQDIPVLKAGSAGHADTSADVLLVELPRRQAEQLAVVLGARGTAAQISRYVLRPAAQNGKGYLPNAPGSSPSASGNDTVITPADLGSPTITPPAEPHP